MRNHDLRLLCAVSTRIEVSADRSLLRRLLNILIENAIKYTPNGGVITLRLFAVENAAHLEVIDDGIGIATDMQKSIFERLVRVTPERTNSSEHGYGLGLAIARWIAELHGFSLELKSVLGQGSTFRIVFPLSSYQSYSRAHG
jgi:signal transduction histidine kinase